MKQNASGRVGSYWSSSLYAKSPIRPIKGRIKASYGCEGFLGNYEGDGNLIVCHLKRLE